MKNNFRHFTVAALVLVGTIGNPQSSSASSDPRVSSWFTAPSGKYARIYETDADLNAGSSKTTWNRGSVNQDAPAYSGVQEVYSSADWVYLRTTGLGFHTMGPWYLGAARMQLFPNLPANTKTLYSIQRNPTVPATKTLTGLGAIGYFVDGVAMFDSRDGFFWNGGSESSSGGTGYWNRDAYVNEGITFDPANAHQEQSGMYHYHANPIALRHLIGDNVAFDSATKRYSENTDGDAPQHSPILGWVRDGHPIYGPYGFSDATDASSGVRRMISGYALRNGQNGTEDLAATGRATIPQWAARVYNVSSNQAGPNVSTTYPLGRYMEDNAYLGDLGKVQGVDFDLDEYNGRFCVTPEFPEGAYAYFVSIEADGTPTFPYNIGRAFYGSPTGASVTSIAETVTTHFEAGPNVTSRLSIPAVSGGTVTLVWNAVEGGTYEVQSSTTLTDWTSKVANISATETSVQADVFTSEEREFYRVIRTALADYDPVTATAGGGEGNGITGISPSSGARGSSVTATITLSSTATSPVPPINAPVNSVTIGATSGINVSRPTRYIVQATFNLPSGAETGPQTVMVTFPGPPANPTATVTYTLTNGFTIQ